MNLSSPRMLTLKNNKEEFMNMFNLVARFWRMAEDSGATTSEAALYFYLLNRANTQMWRNANTLSYGDSLCLSQYKQTKCDEGT